jgi:FixJ family two-component response regulator
MATLEHHTVVAVVEDDVSMLRSVKRLLSALGFATELYDSAETYLHHAKKSAANCLLLDIDLGGISGIELKRRLTASGSRLPVIFMTAIEDERTKNDALAAGCVAFLQKPFAAAALMQALERIKK